MNHLRLPSSRRLARLAGVVGLAGLAGASAGGCDRAPGGRDVIVITLDTTRADRLGVYGEPDVRTPTVDRLARGGTLWVHGIADVPITLPSHTTMFTGYPALAHGVRYNADLKVGANAVTLAERFADLGYRTGAVVSTLVLDAKFGLDQGFHTYDDDLTPGYTKYDDSKYTAEEHWLPRADRRAAETVDRAAGWIAREARSPFFLWVHFYDAHYPYDPPPPWGDTHEDGYAAEIQYVDHELRRLLRALDERTSKESVVLVTADHGEGLDDHREDGHGIFVYDETIRIPWILRAPGLARGVVAEQARTVDLAPTLLALAGHPDDEFGVGVDLTIAADSIAYAESVKSRIFYGGSGLKALRTPRFKYVLAPREELYDLVVDPRETTNIFGADPERDTFFREELARRVRSLRGATESSVQPARADARTLAALSALGYLSGGSDAAGSASVEAELTPTGNDPKDLVDVSMSAQAIQNGYHELAEEKLRRFFASPPPPDAPGRPRLLAAAHQNWAKIWMVRGDYARAAEDYRLAQEADSTYDHARWCRVWALNLAGEPERAEREGAALLADAPNSWLVRYHRGVSLALAGRIDEARRELEAVAANAPAEEQAARGARFYASRVGGPEHERAMAAYLRETSL